MRIKKIKELIEQNQEDKLKEVLDEESLKILEEMEDDDKNLLKKERKFRNFQRLVLYIFIIFFIIWLLFYFAIGFTSAPNEDMRPAFHGSDLVIYDKLNKNPGINDVIAFEKGGTTYLGRVIARPGDTVEILDTGGIKVNGSAYIENYIYGGTKPLTTVEYPLKLDENECFVLVDDRENGEDSRYFGAVKQSEILGKTAFLIRRSGF